MRTSTVVKAFTSAILLSAALLPAQSLLPYQNPALPLQQRVNDLVSRMTLEEKVSQMQNHAVGIPRLNVPEYDWWSEALHGVARNGYATVFPQAIGMASTWDTDLIHRQATVISTEARAKHAESIAHGDRGIYAGLDFWSPNINIFRDPRWGRGQETYGEDPYLTSRIGVAFVESMQGNDPRYFKVIATPKHYAVHSGPESLRHTFNVEVSPFDLEDTYLPAFRATITEAHADSIMCAYNAIDGQPACANTMLLVDHLRHDWHFHGYVTSDCAAIEDVSVGHKFAATLEAGSVAAVKAGTDTTCGREYSTLVNAVKTGKLEESYINTAVKNLFTARFRLGMFDPPASVPYAQIPVTENDTPAHRQLALEAANKSIVLLKNDNHILPLSPSVHTIAVVGPNAANLTSITGNYTGTPSQPVTPLKGLESYFAGKAKIIYAQGSSFSSELPVTVPRSIFHPSAGASENGLKAEYFSTADFSGTPVLTRTDQQLNFSWQGAAPVPGTTTGRYSVRWTGTIGTSNPGDYTFNLYKNDCYPCDSSEQVRVYLDGKQVMHGGRRPRSANATSFNDPAESNTFTAHFDGTSAHALRVEYSHDGAYRGGGLSLEWQPDATALRNEAVTAAKSADVVVAFVGLSPDLEGEEMPVHVDGFSGGDRTDIKLPTAQQQLLEAVAATGKPLVVVLMNGSALSVNWAKDHAAAILEAWYPGEEGGTAIAQTLAGKNNPAGRLPLTFYTSVNDLPPFTEYAMKNRTYRFYEGTPLYPFGYGLSYTTFAYSNLKLSAKTATAGQHVIVEATVTNTGKAKGDEVAELYLVPPGSNAPIRELRGFKRISLAPGASSTVHFSLDSRDLSTVQQDGTRSVIPGSYKIYVGGSQPGGPSKGLEDSVTITGTVTLPK